MKNRKMTIKFIIASVAALLSIAFCVLGAGLLNKAAVQPSVMEYEASVFGISTVGSRKLTVVARGAADGEKQIFRYRVTGKSAEEFIDFEVLVVGNGSVTIKNMPTGYYVVTEIQDGTWRYETVAISRNVNLSATLAGAAVFDHERTQNRWLNEFSDVTTV